MVLTMALTLGSKVGSTAPVVRSSAATRLRVTPPMVEKVPATYNRSPATTTLLTRLVSARNALTAPVWRSTAATRARGWPLTVVKSPPRYRVSPCTARVLTMPLVSARKPGITARVFRSNAATLA